MAQSRPAAKLTHDTASRLVQEAAAAAANIGQPQVIVVVDEGCNLVAMLRMDGARLLSFDSAKAKAVTSANSGAATGGLSPEMEARLGAATQGKITNLKGGFPIYVDGALVGGLGIGTGSPEQDIAVGTAALQALGLRVRAARERPHPPPGRR